MSLYVVDYQYLVNNGIIASKCNQIRELITHSHCKFLFPRRTSDTNNGISQCSGKEANSTNIIEIIEQEIHYGNEIPHDCGRSWKTGFFKTFRGIGDSQESH